MNVASLENCKILYELSGWNPDEWAYDTSYADNWLRHIADFPEGSRERRLVDMIPAYETGFLLRKLPLWVNGFSFRMNMDFVTGTGWVCGYEPTDRMSFKADTPEDCAAKLCIELIQQKVIKIEEE